MHTSIDDFVEMSCCCHCKSTAATATATAAVANNQLRNRLLKTIITQQTHFIKVERDLVSLTVFNGTSEFLFDHVFVCVYVFRLQNTFLFSFRLRNR